MLGAGSECHSTNQMEISYFCASVNSIETIEKEEAIISFILLVIIVNILHQETKAQRENVSHKTNDSSCHCISSLDVHIHQRDTQARAKDQFSSLTTMTKKL